MSSIAATNLSLVPVAAAVPHGASARSLDTVVGGGGKGRGRPDHPGRSGSGGGLLGGINIGKLLAMAALGAFAASALPPLAFLGGPIGGAIAGAVLSLL